MGRAGGGAAWREGSGIRVPIGSAAAGTRTAGWRMLGCAAQRLCPRGLRRRGRGALLTLLALLALVALGSVLRERHIEREPGPQISPRPRSPLRTGSRDPVLRRPPLQENALGAQGEAVRLQLEGEELRLQEESVKLHQINIYLSDRISLHRRLPERWNPL